MTIGTDALSSARDAFDAPRRTAVHASLEARALYLVLAVAAAVRLPGLTHPRALVFDEIYYVHAVRGYVCGEDHFATGHPPLAALIAAASGRLLGMSCDAHTWIIGSPLTQSDALAVRLPFALAGIATVGAIFKLLRLLGASTVAASVAALAVALDNAHAVQTRTLAPDAFLVLFEVLALVAAAKIFRSETSRAPLAVAMGAAIAAAGLVKLTGYAVVVPCALLAYGAPARATFRRDVVRFSSTATLALATAVAVSVIVFATHFRLTRILAFGASPRPFLTELGEFLRMNAAIHRSATMAHYPGSSKWFTWPFDQSAMYFWRADRSHIFLIGNPAVWWGVSATVLGISVMEVLARCTRLPGLDGARFVGRWPHFALLAGFFAAYLPYAAIDRVMFLYHYLPPLTIGIAAAALWLDRAEFFERQGRPRVAAVVLVVLAAAFFALLAPVTFGWEMPSWYAPTIRWLVPQAR